MSEPKKLLIVEDLQKYFTIRKGILRRKIGQIKAVDNVTFHIRQNETLGLVGESGCGKTTIGRCLVKVYNPTGGSINYMHGDEPIDIVRAGPKALKTIRQNVQMIFQNPYSSLDPRMSVGEILREPLQIHRKGSLKEQKERVADIIEKVGLSTYHLDRYPHEFSGGQRQRIGIARSLIIDPTLVICDEAVSALDVSIQAQIINLLKDLQKEFGLTYLFIAHNLSVIEYISDRIVVMYLGRVVEIADAQMIYTNPKHPYTEALLSAVPVPDPRVKKTKVMLHGTVPSPANPPSGCYFHTRCRYAQDICRRESPILRDARTSDTSHMVACHLADDLVLNGFENRKVSGD